MNLRAHPKVKLEKQKGKFANYWPASFAFATMTKHNRARARTSLNITQQSYQFFFNQILEILSLQNGMLIIDI